MLLAVLVAPARLESFPGEARSPMWSTSLPCGGNSSTFYVMDLTSHLALSLSSDVKPSPTGSFFEREFAWKSTFPALPPDRHERVEEIFWEVIDFSGDEVSWRFLVHWPGRPPEDDAWIPEADLQRLHSDLWEPLPSFFVNSSESSSFDPGRIDGERDPSPPLRETSTIQVHRIIMFFIFRSSFSKNFGPFLFSGPDYCPSLLIPLLGFIGPFLLGPNESYGHVCVCWSLFGSFLLVWASSGLSLP